MAIKYKQNKSISIDIQYMISKSKFLYQYDRVQVLINYIIIIIKKAYF